MRLQSGNLSFDLEIVGYQFPHLSQVPYESNWLVIKGEVSVGEQSWVFEEPCLLTYEVAELADWLERLGRGQAVNSTLGFLEPNLEFSVAVNKVLRIYFELEARPADKWFPGIGHDLYIEFPIESLLLGQAAAALRSQLAKYPQRTAR